MAEDVKKLAKTAEIADAPATGAGKDESKQEPTLSTTPEIVEDRIDLAGFAALKELDTFTIGYLRFVQGTAPRPLSTWMTALSGINEEL